MRPTAKPGANINLSLHGADVVYLHAEHDGVLHDRGAPIGYRRLISVLFRDHPRVRRVVWSPPGQRAYAYFLHWSNGEALDDLDIKTEIEEAAEDDVRDALVGEITTRTCVRCRVPVVTLSRVPGLPVGGGEEARRVREHAFVVGCPACGAPWEAAGVLETVELRTG
jgi:hypothetical protein